MHLEIKSSPGLKLFIVTLHVVAMLVVSQLSVADLYKVIVIAALLLSAMYYLSPWLNKWKKTPVLLEKNAEDCWALSYSNGARYQDLRLVKSIVTPGLIILYLAGENLRLSIPVLLIADMLDAQEMRKLRVYLRHDAKVG